MKQKNRQQYLKKTSSKKNLIITALALLVIFPLIAFATFLLLNYLDDHSVLKKNGESSSLQENSTRDKIIAKSGATGGLCSDGEICDSVWYSVYSDGAIKDWNEKLLKTLSKVELEELEQMIDRFDRNSYIKLTNRTCPSDVDGADVYYVFPQKSEERFYPCHYQILDNDSLLNYLEEMSTTFTE